MLELIYKNINHDIHRHKFHNNLRKKEQYIKELKQYKGKCKGKVHPRTGHKGIEWEWIYRSTISLTSDLHGGGWETPYPCHFIPQEKPGTHCTGSWVGPRAGLDSCGKSCSQEDLIPGPISPQPIAKQTEVPQLTEQHKSNKYYNQGIHRVKHHDSFKAYIGHTGIRCKIVYALHIRSNDDMYTSK